MLACFEAFARLGSREIAATELNVTEGAVAKQLRALEQWVDTPLFESSGREAALTAAGRRLAQSITAGMETIQIGLGEFIQLHGNRRELRLLVPATLSMRWLVPRLPRLERAGLEFSLRVHPTHTGEDWLSTPHDAAIRRDGFLPPHYRQEVLFQEELVAYVSPAWAEYVERPGDVQKIPLLESRPRTGELDRWLAAWDAPMADCDRVCLPHFYTAYEAALAGEGLLVVPTIIAAEDVHRGRLIELKPDVRLQGARHMLLWRKSHEATFGLSELAGLLRRETGRHCGTEDAQPVAG